MNCDQARAKQIDYLNDELSDAEWAALDLHLFFCEDCRQEMRAVRKAWDVLGNASVPEPSARLRTNFYAMLETYKQEQATAPTRSVEDFLEWLRGLFTPRLALRLAYSLGLLALGVAGGYWFQAKRSSLAVYQTQVAALTTQVEEMREGMLLSLIENPSATERLRGVGYSKDIGQVNAQVTEALLATLNNDPNVNVRLVTLEALIQRAQDPRVREGLVQSLPQQESPLVQSALADAMVTLQEKRSLKPLRQLLRQKNLNGFVKTKIEESIRALS